MFPSEPALTIAKKKVITIDFFSLINVTPHKEAKTITKLIICKIVKLLSKTPIVVPLCKTDLKMIKAFPL
ncbi:Uncharacterised protein [Mycoplasmopsis arginini]|nr:Uncharacterised protein [Chlamydia abortus]SGA25223.1 Uncharacterised protein [Mycoplasmopsis arginini]SGA27329.1 Uncharacterised protein [Mycoplasmopsis arginini]SGA30672.1 Uncharacterised protein [Chlamydia abortus]